MRDSWGWDSDDESWSSPEAADRYAEAVRQAIDDAYKRIRENGVEDKPMGTGKDTTEDEARGQ